MITGVYPGNKPDSFCMKIPGLIFNSNYLKSFGMHLPGGPATGTMPAAARPKRRCTSWRTGSFMEEVYFCGRLKSSVPV
jgi:hypothetical protein